METSGNIPTMASTGTLSTNPSNDCPSVSEVEDQAKESPQVQLALVEQDMSKPSRPPPKVFASPRKSKQTGPKPSSRTMTRSKSMKAKLRRALAPYLTSTYLQGEITKQFTREYLAAHPPPESEADLPEYVQQHLLELNRVTENWTSCMGRALDQFLHDSEVDERLQRIRAQQEGRLRSSQGGAAEEEDDLDDLELDPDLKLASPTGVEGGLTRAQIFGAVHLVSDVKVWQQILAAQEAEERRQHAIAELHMHHAARIIQRSWRSFVTQKKEEQARLDALVSPDVQAMLSAAAYKAMRDARNKLAVMKLRKSFSQKFHGFGSTTPRDLDPITPNRLTPPPSSLVGVSSPSAFPRRKKSSMTSAPRPDGGDGEGTDDYTSQTPSDGASSSRGDSRFKAFAARSQRFINRLVSMKDLVGGEAASPDMADDTRSRAAEDVEQVAGMGGSEGGASGQLGPSKHRQKRRSRLSRVGPRPTLESQTGENGAGEQPEGGEEVPRQRRRSRLSMVGLPNRTSIDLLDGEGNPSRLSFGTPDGDAEGEEEEQEGFDEEVGESDSLCASGSEMDEGETAELAMAEAEEVVEVAAQLAKAFMGAGDSSEGSDAEDGDEEKMHISGEALEALLAMEAAAAAAGGGSSGSKAAARSSLLASPPPQAAARALGAAEAEAEAEADSKGRSSSSGVHRSSSMTQDSAVLKQLIAGALAAAASPLLGRKKALTVAQLGFGDLLQLPGAKGLLPRAAAVAARANRSTSQAPTEEVPLASFGRGGGGGRAPLEIRATAVSANRCNNGVGLRRLHASDSGAEPTASFEAAAGAGTMGGGGQAKAGRASARKSVGGEIPDGGAQAATLLPPPPPQQQQQQQAPRAFGAVTLPAVHVTYGTAPGAADVMFESMEALAAARRHSHAGAIGVGSPGSGGSPHGPYGQTGSPTAISAAAAAARATQPWASPRRTRPPPGAHTMASSLPDPRGGAAKDPSVPREPTWLLPPINRSSTGPATLGGGGAGGGGVLSPTAAAHLVTRAPSDPNLQRPGGPGGALNAAAAAATGFVINSLNGNAAVQRARMGYGQGQGPGPASEMTGAAAGAGPQLQHPGHLSPQLAVYPGGGGDPIASRRLSGRQSLVGQQSSNARGG